MPAISHFFNSVYDAHPDDVSSKEVYLQAAGLTYIGAGDRHVLIWWSNGTTTEDNVVSQIVQLTGSVGNYGYYSPVAQQHSPDLITANEQISLGAFTRAQRDQILRLAKAVQFEKSSNVNGCRVWTRDLLEEMVHVGLISQVIFDRIDAHVPLVKRRPEAQ